MMLIIIEKDYRLIVLINPDDKHGVKISNALITLPRLTGKPRLSLEK